MVDACLIQHRTGETTDPDTGVVTPAYGTVYAGKCRVQQQPGIARPATPGEAYVWLTKFELQLPMSVTGVDTDDLVTITVSVLDADLTGRVWHARALAHKTHATSRRIQCEEVTG